jgi:NADPH:quinone reductase-like Zn-dependent oxidoreductase
MKAVEFTGKGAVENLEFVSDAEKPNPAEGEILVRVKATSITPGEFSWSTNWEKADGSPRPLPVIPGHDFFGTIAELGKGVSQVRLGEEVFSLIDFWRNWAEAEYTIVLPTEIAPKPKSPSHEAAATVLLAGLTAWQALFDHASLTRRQRVLVQGGIGRSRDFRSSVCEMGGGTRHGNCLQRQPRPFEKNWNR